MKTLVTLLILIGGIAIAQQSITPSNENIQYFGRWDHNEPEKPKASWGAVYIKVKFNGTGISINFNDPNNHFQYQLDGGTMTELAGTSAQSYTLASGLSSGEHELAFYRRSSGGWGMTEFLGFDIDGTILPPNDRPCLKMEFVGNSISVGFNNENIGQSAMAENGYMAWGPQLARLYDAEWRVEGHSGQGMYQNLYETGGQNPTMADEFEFTHFPNTPKPTGVAWDHPNDEWDFEEWKPDVFFCSLGTNDFAGTAPTEAQFNGRYNEFLERSRIKSPDATIGRFGMCLKTWDVASDFDDANTYLQNLVTQRTAAGDAHIFFANPRPDGTDASLWLPNASDYSGDWTHPTIAGDAIIAQKMFDFLTPKINPDPCGEIMSTFAETPNTEVLLFPNPTSGLVNLSSPSNWSVYSSTGLKLEEGSSATIDLGTYGTGTYFISTTSGKASKVIKE
jgi:lysophospholipase L1-like esterase